MSFLLISILIPARHVLAQATQDGYHLLQPLPSLTTFNPDSVKDPHALGTYVNIIIKLFIGLCAVLAVVMIVIGGIEYATSELISGKEAGKERIRGALLGLLLALGAYTILYQINPNLLNTDVAIDQATLSVTQQDFEIAPPIIKPDSGPIPTGRVAACGNGIVKTKSGMYSCADIAQNVDNMIDAAKQAGLDMSGGGFRTNQDQINLRVAHCNGNTTDAHYPCHPPTALPGHSRHESGLAFDLSCSGRTIQSHSNSCFIWLQNNASRYGLHNLPSEPWHWSIDGN